MSNPDDSVKSTNADEGKILTDEQLNEILKNDSKDSQEQPQVKKDDSPSWKDKKNDANNDYEYSDDKELDDTQW